MRATRFETLLRIRRNRRDQIRKLMKVLIDEGEQITQQLNAMLADQRDIQVQLSRKQTRGRIDVDALVSQRHHAAYLSAEISRLRSVQQDWKNRFARGQQLLANAENHLRSLERLQELEAQKESRRQLRAADREASDRFAAQKWQAAETSDAGHNPSCDGSW